jgi:hypothetical protein
MRFLALAALAASGCGLLLGIEDPTLGPGGGGPGVLDVDEQSVEFGDLGVAAAADTKMVTVRNTGGEALTVGVTIEGAGFALASNPCGTLTGGATCQPEVAFDPGVAGDATGILHVTAGQTEIDLPLTGRGLARLEISIGGTGTGIVTIEELPMMCTISCAVDIARPTVTLLAQPTDNDGNTDHVAARWMSPCLADQRRCEVTMDQPRSLSVDFLAPITQTKNGANLVDFGNGIAYQTNGGRTVVAGSLGLGTHTAGWLGFWGTLGDTVVNSDQIGLNNFSAYHDVEVDRANGFAAAGAYADATGTDYDFFVRKFDDQGNVIWTRTYGSTTLSERALGVAVGPNDEIVAVGEESIAGQCTNLVVRKYLANGDFAWGKNLDLGACDKADDVAIDGAGNVYVVGESEANTALPTAGSAVILKYDVNGTVAPTSPRIFTTANHRRVARDLVVDGDGTIFVSGGDHTISGGGYQLSGWVIHLATDLSTIAEAQDVGFGDLNTIALTPDGRISTTTLSNFYTLGKDFSNKVNFNPKGGFRVWDHLYRPDGTLVVAGQLSDDVAWRRYFSWTR